MPEARFLGAPNSAVDVTALQVESGLVQKGEVGEFTEEEIARLGSRYNLQPVDGDGNPVEEEGAAEGAARQAQEQAQRSRIAAATTGTSGGGEE